MYCTKCGKQISDDSKFCDGCGNPVAAKVAEPYAAQIETESVREETQGQLTEHTDPLTNAEPQDCTVSGKDSASATEETSSESPAETQCSSEENTGAQSTAVVLSPEVLRLKQHVEETGKKAFTLFKSLSPKKKSILLAVPIIILLVVVIVSFSDGGVSDDDYISCAKTAVSKQLKSPGSAFYSNEKVVEKDDYGRVLVVLTVDSQNGFGAYLRSHYVVVIESYDSKTEEFTYSRNGIQHWTDDMDFLEEILIQSAKDASDWNEPLEKE